MDGTETETETVYPAAGREKRSEQRGGITAQIARWIGATRRGTNDNVKANRERKDGRQSETGTESGRARKEGRERDRRGVLKGNGKRGETQDGKREREARARGSSFRGSRLD